jgi:hypothetical protein
LLASGLRIAQDAACADYTAAIEIDPNDTALFNGRAFAGLRAAAVKDGAAAQTTLQRALEDVDRALTLDDCNGPAHCTRGAILKQLALGVANGATDKAAAAVAGGESQQEWTRLIEGAIAAQRAAIRLEQDAQEPRDYLRELLAMLGIEENVADVQYKSVWASARRSVPAPRGDEAGQRCKEGWLHKKGGLKDGERNWIKGGKRNWKARWVAVDERSIRWYDVKGGKELGNVQLTVFDQVEMDADKYVYTLLRLTAPYSAGQTLGLSPRAPTSASVRTSLLLMLTTRVYAVLCVCLCAVLCALRRSSVALRCVSGPASANKFCVRTPDRDLWLKAEDEASASEWVASVVANLS